MPVLVMKVRVVGMGMDQARMTVSMGVRLSLRIIREVDMLMMVVMNMKVFVLHGVMFMGVLVAFRHMKPNPNQHEDTGHQKHPIKNALPKRERKGRADKRSEGKVRTGPRRSEISERENKKD